MELCCFFITILSQIMPCFCDKNKPRIRLSFHAPRHPLRGHSALPELVANSPTSCPAPHPGHPLDRLDTTLAFAHSTRAPKIMSPSLRMEQPPHQRRSKMNVGFALLDAPMSGP